MHFCHENVIGFDDRPFVSVEKMNETLVENWNSRVSEEDTVYILGDGFWKNEENSVKLIQRLNGHKHLIRGNHDRVNGRLKDYYESIESYGEVNDEGRLVILSHYPMLFYKNQRYGAVMLYGHVHNSVEWRLVEKFKENIWDMRIPCRLINVGCMMKYMDYTPRTLDELLKSNSHPPTDKGKITATLRRKILRNAIQCKLCGDVIESKYRHDYVTCSCGACTVDGGHDYLRRGFKERDCYVDLSETEIVEVERWDDKK